MKKIIKRIILFPIWIILFVVFLPIDFVLVMSDKNPLGMELLDWYWD